MAVWSNCLSVCSSSCRQQRIFPSLLPPYKRCRPGAQTAASESTAVGEAGIRSGSALSLLGAGVPSIAPKQERLSSALPGPLAPSSKGPPQARCRCCGERAQARLAAGDSSHFTCRRIQRDISAPAVLRSRHAEQPARKRRRSTYPGRRMRTK